jgi:hypothetical protein
MSRARLDTNEVRLGTDIRYSGHRTPLDLCHATIDE